MALFLIIVYGLFSSTSTTPIEAQNAATATPTPSPRPLALSVDSANPLVGQLVTLNANKPAANAHHGNINWTTFKQCDKEVNGVAGCQASQWTDVRLRCRYANNWRRTYPSLYRVQCRNGANGNTALARYSSPKTIFYQAFGFYESAIAIGWPGSALRPSNIVKVVWSGATVTPTPTPTATRTPRSGSTSTPTATPSPRPPVLSVDSANPSAGQLVTLNANKPADNAHHGNVDWTTFKQCDEEVNGAAGCKTWEWTDVELRCRYANNWKSTYPSLYDVQCRRGANGNTALARYLSPKTIFYRAFGFYVSARYRLARQRFEAFQHSQSGMELRQLDFHAHAYLDRNAHPNEYPRIRRNRHAHAHGNANRHAYPNPHVHLCVQYLYMDYNAALGERRR